MGVLSDRLALLIEQMKASDERLEALTSYYIQKTTRQLKEMEDMLKNVWTPHVGFDVEVN